MPAPRGGGCVGVLMAGGASRRFSGMPKGFARIEGTRIADLVLERLALVCDQRLVVANDPRATRWFAPLDVHPDADGEHGPLAGLASALRAARGDPVLVVAWDMPFVTTALLAALRARGDGDGVSVVPVHGDRAVAEPLCAYYRAESLPTVERLLAAGESRARALFDALRQAGGAIALADTSLESVGEPGRLFTSVDSPLSLLALGGELPRAP